MGLKNQNDTPLSGGLAIIVAWWIAVILFGVIAKQFLIPFIFISIIIIFFGAYDSRKPLSALNQLLIQTLIALIAVFGAGIGVHFITNPFGGIFDLSQIVLVGITLGQVLSLVWIIGIMNVINFLDGLDGLAGSVAMISFIAIGLVSLLPQVDEPATSILAFSGAVATFGFLFWNIPPARVLMGTTGSWFLGFLIAILAINGASKVATTAVVGAIPLIDALVVVFGRILRGVSPMKGDLTHLHHRLRRRGLSDKVILVIYGVISLGLGVLAVILQTHEKIKFFSGFAVFLLIGVFIGSWFFKHKTPLT